MPPPYAARRGARAALLVVVAVALAGAGAARAADPQPAAAVEDEDEGTTVAVMPLGTAVLLPSVRDALDADLRAAVAAQPGLVVQPADETQAHIQEAGQNGLDLVHCPPSREDCALRVGVLADVDYVVTFAVEEVGDRLLLRGGWLATDGTEKRFVAGELYAKDKDPMELRLRALVASVVTGKGEPSDLPYALSVEPSESLIYVDGAPRSLSQHYLWLPPGEHVLRIEAPQRAPQERIIKVSPDGVDNELVLALAEADTPVPFYVGLGVASAGGLLAMGAAAVAVVEEYNLEQGRVPFAQRDGALFTGRVSVGVVAAGALMLGGGAVVAVVGGP